uniref:Uncharacterized protein LOC102807206 n=1 Tax=Saccoglossus kowalevskii TaxID=10224 RepID=A0ABM0LYJ2_SACKO
MMDMYFTEDDAISLFAPDMDDLFKDTSVVQDASKKRVLFSDRGQKEASSHYNNNNIKKNYCSVKVEKDQHSKFEEPEQSVSSLDNSEIIIRNRNTDNSTAPCVSDRTSKKRKREENNDHSVKKQRFGNKTIDNKVQTKGNTNNPGNQTPTFIKTYKPLVYRASIDTYLVENKPGEAWRVLKTAPLCLQSDVHLLDQILQRCETAKDPDIKQPNDNILMGLIRHHNHHGEYGRQWEVLKKCDTFDIVPGKNVINEIVQGLSKWNQEKKMMATAILHKHYPVFDNGASCVNNDIVNRGIRRPVSILGSPPNVHPRNAPPDVKQAVCSEAVRQNAAFGKDHGSPHKLPRRGYNRTEYHEKRSHSRPSVSYEAKYSSQVGRNSRNTDQCRQASRMSKNTDHFRRRGRTNREVDQCSQASRESKKMDQWSSVNGCDVSQSDTGYLSYGDNNKDMNDSLGKIDTRLDVHATKHYVETIKNTRHVADLAQTYHKISFENLNMMTNEVKRAFIKCLVREQETCGRKFLEFIKNIEKCYKTDLREDDKKILAFIAIGILCTCYDNNIWSEGFHLLYALHSYNIFYLHMVPYKDEMIFPANCM